MTTEATLEAESAINKIDNKNIKKSLETEISNIKEIIKSNEESKNENSENYDTIKPSNNKFLYTIEYPDKNYKGHTVDLTDSQYLKVLCSIFGEQEQGSYELYVGLCQYIGDYIEYGSLPRTYDNLGNYWLKRGGTLSNEKNLQWFKDNHPEAIEAVDYVLKKGRSLARRKLCFYVDDDVVYNDNSYTAAYNTLINASCGGGMNTIK